MKLRDLMDSILGSRVGDSGSVPTLAQVVMEIYRGNHQTTLHAILGERKPEDESLRDVLLLMAQGRVDMPWMDFKWAMEVVAGNIPASNPSQEATRSEFIQVLSSYLNMEDPRWIKMRNLYGRGGLSVEVTSLLTAINADAAPAMAEALENLMSSWNHPYRRNPYFHDRNSFTIISFIPSLDPIPKAQLRNVEETVSRVVVNRLLTFLLSLKDEKRTPSLDRAKGVADVNWESGAAANHWSQAMAAAKVVYGAQDLALLSELALEAGEKSEYQQYLAEHLSSMTWDNLLEFARLESEYNWEWAMASMEW